MGSVTLAINSDPGIVPNPTQVHAEMASKQPIQKTGVDRRSNGQTIKIQRRKHWSSYCFSRGMGVQSARDFMASVKDEVLHEPIDVTYKTVHKDYQKLTAIIHKEWSSNFIERQREIRSRILSGIDVQLSELYVLQIDVNNDVNLTKKTNEGRVTNQTGRYSVREKVSSAIAELLKKKFEIEMTPLVDEEIEKQVIAHAKQVLEKHGIGNI